MSTALASHDEYVGIAFGQRRFWHRHRAAVDRICKGLPTLQPPFVVTIDHARVSAAFNMRARHSPRPRETHLQLAIVVS